MKVKIFSAQNVDELQGKINEFIEQYNIDIVKIDINITSCSTTAYMDNFYVEYIGSIVYNMGAMKAVKEEEPKKEVKPKKEIKK